MLIRAKNWSSVKYSCEDGEQRRDFTHVYDIVDGLVKSAEKLVDGEVNGQFFELGSGVNYSINELAAAFEGHPNVKIPKRAGEMRETLCTDTIKRSQP